MYQPDKKFLISGCGISWSGQPAPTWTRLLQSAGVPVVDVGGPAVSNQWILNRAMLALDQDPDIGTVIVQLTGIGKLDVEMLPGRQETLVENDSQRNFVIDGVWPSGVSQEHPAKQAWHEWLWSPGLEQQDIMVKLIMLQDWCGHREIPLRVLQGYNLRWNLQQQQRLSGIVYDIQHNIMDQYHASEAFCVTGNSVPVLDFQWQIIDKVQDLLSPDVQARLDQARRIKT